MANDKTSHKIKKQKKVTVSGNEILVSLDVYDKNDLIQKALNNYHSLDEQEKDLLLELLFEKVFKGETK